MKNKNRHEILQRMLTKTHQIMDDIIDLTMRIYTTQPSIYSHLEETPLSVDKKKNEDYRNTLIALLKESEQK